MELRLDGIRRALATHLWALQPEYLDAMMDVLALRAQGIKLSDEEIQTRIAAADHGSLGASAGAARTTGGATVAVIPIYGMIAQRAGMVNQASGPRGTSIEQIRQQFDAAMANPEVGGLLLDVDSPGGTVTGVPELARHIFNARGQKPITAIANGMMASAAYYLGSAADEVVVTPSGEAGSIGVYTVHEDLSGMLAARGVTATVIKAGKFKAEGHPAQPLTDEAREAMQVRVDEAYDLFVEAVGRHRSATPSAVRNGFGEGRVLSAKAAVAAGLADRVATWEDTVRRSVSAAQKAAPRATSGGRRAAQLKNALALDAIK